MEGAFNILNNPSTGHEDSEISTRKFIIDWIFSIFRYIVLTILSQSC